MKTATSERAAVPAVQEAYIALRKAAVAENYAEYARQLIAANRAICAVAPEGLAIMVRMTNEDVHAGLKSLVTQQEISERTAAVLRAALQSAGTVEDRLRSAEAMAKQAEESEMSMLLAKFALLDATLYANGKRLKEQAGDAGVIYGEGGSDEYRNATDAVASSAGEGAATGAVVGGAAGAAAGAVAGAEAGAIVGAVVGGPLGAGAGAGVGLVAGAVNGGVVGAGIGGVWGAIVGGINSLFGGKKKKGGSASGGQGSTTPAAESSDFHIPPGREDDPTFPCNDPFSGVLC